MHLILIRKRHDDCPRLGSDTDNRTRRPGMRTPFPLSRLILYAILALPGAAALADPLYTLTLLGGTGSTATGINRWGDVVGNTGSGGAARGFGWLGFLSTGAGLVDLNTVVDPASGWMITDASGINDAAQIAATACHGGVTGDCRAVRLDLVAAVPEPASLATLGLGPLLIGARTRRTHRVQA
jgi:hypothetical protein